jgi:hypothetical protein
MKTGLEWYGTSKNLCLALAWYDHFAASSTAFERVIETLPSRVIITIA